MLKKLLGRHRSLRIGATIVGASALAIGFASPALAAQNVNNGNADNATAQNNIVVEGGSNTTYTVMEAMSVVFNEAPGCDTVGLASPDAQPLDYGCPGMNGETGGAQPAALTHTYSGVAVTSGSKKFHLSGSGLSDLAEGDQVTDSAGVIPVADTVKSANTATGKIKLQFKATGNAPSDTFTVNYNGQQGENGYIQWGNDNPFNDVLVEEPSYGSSNGVAELEGTGSASVVGHSNNTVNPSSETQVPNVPVSPLDIARSSRAPSLSATGDFQGLNFVAYAEDAVSYFYWTKYNGATTTATKCLSSIGIANISTALLKQIWNETYSGSTPSVTWSALDGGADPSACPATPVYAYWSQNGSGTEATWATATGASFPGPSSNWPSKQIVFENESSSILGNASHVNPGDVMFFFSYGKYSKECTPDLNTADSTYLQSTNPVCAGTSTVPSVPNTVQLGTKWNGNELTTTAINNQLPGLEGAEFQGDRLIYNVYSDGSNPNIPASSPAALNIVSEDGFTCKPATTTDIDANTGATFRSEIDTTIEDFGFLPLPQLQVENGQGDTAVAGYNSTEAGIPNPAWHDGLSASKYNASAETVAPWNWAAANVDTDNSAVSGTYQAEDGSSTPSTVNASAANPVGYCITMSTDASPRGD